MTSRPPLRTVIVDDEHLARQELRYLLRDFSDIEILAEADCVDRAACLIDEKRPDLVFLDVQMRGETGFDLFDLVDVPFRVVFVTGYDQYAIRAFEINALDYLLKPVRSERLAEAVRRVLEDTSRMEQGGEQFLHNDIFFLRFGKRARFVNIHDIVYISAAGDYSEVTTIQGHHALVLCSLKQWEERLPSELFVRTHRSTIVNLNCVERLEPMPNNAFLIHLQGQEETLRMSRRYASKIRSRSAIARVL